MNSQKIKRAIDEYRHQLEYWLTHQRLLPNHQSYQKFVIICGIRTGSTMLCSLLGHHTKTLVFFELFHRHFGSTPFNVPGYRNKSLDKRIVELRNSDPVKFINTEVYKPLPKKIQAVGFKLLYTQARKNPPWWESSEFDRWWKDVGHPPSLCSAKSDLWAYLKDNTDIAIIHLKRKNLLRSKVSGKTAQDTGNWGIGATGGLGNHRETVKFELDFKECLQDFQAHRRMEDEADEFFSHHKKLVITYEDLLENITETTNKVQEFLGLNIQTLTTVTRKQAQKPLYDVIKNYDQLKNKFVDTPWIDMFDD